MNKYLFETKDFGLSNQGFHFLRSRYNYKTIPFSAIREVSIEKGKELNNWLIILILGIGSMAFSIIYLILLLISLNEPGGQVIYIEQIAAPVLPLLFGAYCLYSSLKNGLIIRFKTFENKKEKFTLNELIKEDKYEDLIHFLKENFNNKFHNTLS